MLSRTSPRSSRATFTAPRAAFDEFAGPRTARPATAGPALAGGLELSSPERRPAAGAAGGRPAARGRRRHLHPRPGFVGHHRRPSRTRCRPAAGRAAVPWRLDPLPLVLEEREWSGLEAGAGAARRAAGRDPGRPVRRPAAAGPAATCRRRRSWTTTSTCAPWSASTSLAGPRLFMVAVDLGRDADGQLEGDLGPDPGAVRRRLRDAEPPGGLPGDARGLPLGPPAPADPVLPGHADRAGRLRAGTGGGPAGGGAQPRHPVRDRVRPGVPGLAARLPAGRGQRPHRARRPGLDAGAGQAGGGRRHPPPGRLDLDRTRWSCGPGSRLGVAGLLECVRQGTVSVVNTSAPASWRTRR